MCDILVVDDEQEVREAVKRRLEREGYRVQTADSEASGLAALIGEHRSFDIVITDMSMEDSDSGLRILEGAMARDVFTEVVVLTAYGNVTNAVECMKRGAFDMSKRTCRAWMFTSCFVSKCNRLSSVEDRRSIRSAD